MRIAIENDRLVVRGAWGKTKFAAAASEIVELRFFAEHTYYGPRLLVWLMRPKLILRAAIVWTEQNGMTLDAWRDRGFEAALQWFQENGWDVDEGSRLAFQTPLVRATVPRKL